MFFLQSEDINERTIIVRLSGDVPSYPYHPQSPLFFISNFSSGFSCESISNFD